ncbi:MAG: lactonase family protein [Verrucomicrobiae bacterium]|nr:lactonase family protein [Verrucomicrobiae bacterium]NNJ42547.1 lactonase family protein [Akkermansiaceae bacterium]
MYPIITLLLIAATVVCAEPTQVYIGTAKQGVYATQLDPQTGTLTEPQLVADINGAGFLAIHPSQKYLYATATTVGDVGSVVAFTIEADGSLSEIGRQPIMGSRLCHISLDASAQILMGANYPGGNVVSLPLHHDGSMGKLVSFHQHEGASVHPQRQTSPHAHSIYRGPNNKFAYAPDLGTDKIMIYAIEPALARLTPFGFSPSPAGAGPRHMKFGENGRQAYVLNELSVSISVYNRNSVSGKLIPHQVVSTLPAGANRNRMTCSEIQISDNGRFIYCANRDLTAGGRDSLSVFSVDGKGNIKLIQTVAAKVWIPRHIKLDPSGKWLLVAGQKSNTLPVFNIDPATGRLSDTGQQIMVPEPMCITFQH